MRSWLITSCIFFRLWTIDVFNVGALRINRRGRRKKPTSDVGEEWTVMPGYIAGTKIKTEKTTIGKAKAQCKQLPGCVGIWYRGTSMDADKEKDINFCSSNDGVKKGTFKWTSMLYNAKPQAKPPSTTADDGVKEQAKQPSTTLDDGAEAQVQEIFRASSKQLDKVEEFIEEEIVASTRSTSESQIEGSSGVVERIASNQSLGKKTSNRSLAKSASSDLPDAVERKTSNQRLAQPAPVEKKASSENVAKPAPVEKKLEPCKAPGYDPATECKECLRGLDIASKCVSCLRGYDESTQCKTCVFGYDSPASGCNTIKPGFAPASCSQAQGCNECREGWDPMVSCIRCSQGYEGGNCEKCMSGFSPRGGSCERDCTTAGCWTMHVIGDTHGDHNYLVRALLSTGLFDLTRDNRQMLTWKKAVSRSNNFEVVVLGDVVDRGSNSLKNLQLLRLLATEDEYGRLKLVLGNHESLLLRHDFESQWMPLQMKGYLEQHQRQGRTKEAVEEYLRWHKGDWNEAEIQAAHKRKHHTATVLDWLRIQPVILNSWAVLLCHGGLSEWALNGLRSMIGAAGKCESASQNYEDRRACGNEVVKRANRMAIAYYKGIKETFNKHGPQRHDTTEPVINDSQGGILWYRGYSTNSGQGVSCDEADRVGKIVGARIMAVAHSTHPMIQRYCGIQAQGGTGIDGLWHAGTFLGFVQGTNLWINGQQQIAIQRQSNTTFDMTNRFGPVRATLGINGQLRLTDGGIWTRVTFVGQWDHGYISGSQLTLKKGSETFNIQMESAIKFNIGPQVSATLVDGKLYWSDGGVWVRPAKATVFVTDTHTEDCGWTGECDYADGKQPYKGGKLDANLPMVPQSLEITFGAGSASPVVTQSRRCLSIFLSRQEGVGRMCIAV